MNHKTMLSKYDKCTRLLKIKTSWKSDVFTNEVGKNSRYFVGVFNKTIIPHALVGYEMIIANSALRSLLATTISHPKRRIIVKYLNMLQATEHIYICKCI